MNSCTSYSAYHMLQGILALWYYHVCDPLITSEPTDDFDESLYEKYATTAYFTSAYFNFLLSGIPTC